MCRWGRKVNASEVPLQLSFDLSLQGDVASKHTNEKEWVHDYKDCMAAISKLTVLYDDVMTLVKFEVKR